MLQHFSNNVQSHISDCYSEPCFLVLLTPAQSLGQKLPRCWHISRAPTLVYRDHLHPGFDPKVSSYNWG